MNRLLALALMLSLASCKTTETAAATGGRISGHAAAGHAAVPSASELPEFKAIDQNGKEWTLLAATKKKPLLIDFWATWCVPCLKSIPDLKAFRDKHQDKVTLLGAATDEKGWAVVKTSIARFGIDYPVIVVNEDLASAYGVEGYPYLVLIKDGRIAKRLLGRHSLEDLEEKLADYIK